MTLLLMCAMFCAPVLNAQAGPTDASTPTAVIDTTMGRLRCRLFAAERPLSTANFVGLAEGTKEWSDPVSGAPVHGKPFYDGTRIYSTVSGVRGGSRAAEGQKAAGPELAAEDKPEMRFDRAGLLAMRGKKGKASGSEFMILDHANAEADGQGSVIFGQCDEASVKVVTAISHSLAAVDNLPAIPIAINHVAIVRAGQGMPSAARDVPVAEIVPAAKEWPVVKNAPAPTGPTAVIETSMGKIACRLFSKESPIAVATFIGLADGTKSWTNPVTKKVETGKRFYDGMPFDRVIPDFVVQNGDPTGDISGATDIGFRFKNENAPGLSYDRPGRLAFGNNGPDTNNSEIFITEAPMRRLDGGFTIIGQCDEASVKVVEAIARVPRDKNNRPIKEVRIVRVRFEAPLVH